MSEWKHGVGAPASKAHAVTPSDDQDLPDISRAIYIGGTGDISVILEYDSKPVTLVAVPAGAVLPVMAKRIRSTGTTATNIVALW